MKITWYGHSAFKVETGDAKILIDPFLTGNPSWDKGWEGRPKGSRMSCSRMATAIMSATRSRS